VMSFAHIKDGILTNRCRLRVDNPKVISMKKDAWYSMQGYSRKVNK